MPKLFTVSHRTQRRLLRVKARKFLRVFFVSNLAFVAASIPLARMGLDMGNTIEHVGVCLLVMFVSLNVCNMIAMTASELVNHFERSAKNDARYEHIFA